MNSVFKSFILDKTGATDLIEKEIIQELWSGYGKIIRINLINSSLQSVVIKHIKFPQKRIHPRGWNSDFGHNRKLKSYKVETNWYKNYSLESTARLPKCFGILKTDEEILIILEDLNTSGFSVRKNQVNWKDIVSCLNWLANFHASFLGKNPIELWNIGTYWHLETRPQELENLKDAQLKKSAKAIDTKLNNCTYKTFVHGDAKLANFCFSKTGEVAGVDFQYVGGGCGIKDVAYFVGSCLSEQECERLESEILNTYFKLFHKCLGKTNSHLEEEWRQLYPIAWADFHRFLKGWSPGHWKINSYSERITKTVINSL